MCFLERREVAVECPARSGEDQKAVLDPKGFVLLVVGTGFGLGEMARYFLVARYV